MKTDVLIIGGGLAGLRLAQLLSEKGIAFRVIEARDRWGGRMLSEHVNGSAFDLGPAWFWQGQPRLAALAREYGIGVFEQYARGVLSFEDEHGEVHRGRGFSSMQGSLRLNGGFGALIGAIAASLPVPALTLNTPAVNILSSGQTIIVKTPYDQIEANRVVLALPPRLVANNIEFEPKLPSQTQAALLTVPTWMAAQAKVVAVYDQPFWRDAGLSGDAMSKRGPLVEIHDASPAQDGPYALFGFVGVPPQWRTNEQELRTAVLAQLERLFGANAATPISLLVKDWALDANTASSLDLVPLFAHPDYSMPLALRRNWNGKLLFSGTETATLFGGYAEGALESAEAAFNTLVE